MRHEPLSKTKLVRVLPAKPVLSFVIPAMNEDATIVATLNAVDAIAKCLVPSHEIIVVDDGSTDTTHAQAIALCAVLPLKVIRLSRNFGKEKAIMAGLVAARGDAIVTMDADLQEPLEAVERMFAHWQNGMDMAYAVRSHRRDEPWHKRLCTNLFYRLLSIGSDIRIPVDARDFRLMDRKIVDAICAMPERNLFMKGIYGWVGFESVPVPVDMQPRLGGKSKFGFRRLFHLALTGITSFTVWPLRVWTVIGTSVALMSLLYGLWIAVRTFLWGVDVPGWSTLVVGMLFLGGVQLFSVGILGEYIANIYTEVKGRPCYIIASEHSSETED